MPIALIGSGVSKAGSGASSAIDTTSTTLLVAVVACQTISAGIADNKSNTWTLIGTVQTGGPFSMQSALYYVNGTPTVGSGHTFSSADSTPALAVLPFSGVATSSALDQHSEAAAQASPAAAGSITPANANEVLIFANGGFWSAGSSVNGGFTLAFDLGGAGGSNYSAAISYLIQTSATAANPALTYTALNANTAHAHLASFSPSGGGGGFTALNRKTLSGIGSHVGGRRPHGWG